MLVGTIRAANRIRLLPATSTVVQQIRTVARSRRIDTGYGRAPLYTDHQYLAAMDDEDQRQALSFEEIRFARNFETNSPLQDDLLEKYIGRTMLHNGRRDLMYDLMHKTFYEIKMAQYKRHLKRKAKQAAAAEKAADGKKQQAMPEDDGEEIEMNPMVLFHKAIENCKPLVVTKKVRRGGATYQVPFPLRASESEWLAMKWLNDTIEERPKPRVKHYYEELAWEIIEAAHGRGKVIKKRDEIHKLAQANKAYAHYRWG